MNPAQDPKYSRDRLAHGRVPPSTAQSRTPTPLAPTPRLDACSLLLQGLEVNTLRPRSCQFKMTVNFGACSCSNARAKELATMRTSFWSTALVALAVATTAAQDQP